MTNNIKIFETQVISSLEKVFPDEALDLVEVKKGSALQNEIYSFQVAYRSNGPLIKNIAVKVESDLASNINLRAVGLAPSEFPIYNDHDDNVLRTQASLFPDPLYKLDNDGITAFTNQWRTIWITVDINESIDDGTYPIKIKFETETANLLGEELFELTVIPVKLPEQELIHTQWFHTDSIMEYYSVELFSSDYWSLVDSYIKTAVDHGINMILTPLFTPPLDTEIGGERPTVQLVDVEKNDETYQFSFSKLLQWVEMCLTNGVKYFEMSHLFTQWGAYHAPKIIATVNGEKKKIFGWNTNASGEEYKAFLAAFLPELKLFIQEHALEDKVYFHVSDEPSLDHLESYKNATDIIYEHLSKYPIIDALSDYAFYENDLVKRPIPATSHIEPFLENQVEDLWTYYCCGQYKEVANRFFTFPSARNRIIGFQLYKYDIKGFLQWGYNFWWSQLSKKAINPFQNTDAGYGFPSGDAFIVYPGEDGPIESIRMEVFYDALQDQRALQLLESLIGKEEVLSILEADLEKELTFSSYPKESQWLLEKREEINQRIATEIANHK